MKIGDSVQHIENGFNGTISRIKGSDVEVKSEEGKFRTIPQSFLRYYNEQDQGPILPEHNTDRIADPWPQNTAVIDWRDKFEAWAVQTGKTPVWPKGGSTRQFMGYCLWLGKVDEDEKKEKKRKGKPESKVVVLA